MRRYFLVIIFFILICPSLFSAPGNLLTISTKPYGTVPMGSSADYFNLGLGVEAGVSYNPAALRFFGFIAGSDFIVLPIDTGDSVWALSGSVGPVFRLPLGERFALHAQGTIGYFYWGPIGWEAEENNRGGLTAGGGVGASFKIAGPFTLGVGASYDYYSNLYNGFNFSLAARVEIPLQKAAVGGIEVQDIRLLPLFPVMYSYYDNNPVGTISVYNKGKADIENIQVSFFVERYMDNPMQCGAAFSLAPGEEKTVNLFGIFSDDVMTITEGTKVSSKISLSYAAGGEQITEDHTPILEFYNRNALQWDDDRKIASFITAKDPAILGFAKNVMTWMKDVENPAIDENLQKGMAIFEAVKTYGVQYEIDPATPFSELSTQQSAIDFLQFPRQTLQYTNGDCDDLSVLYTSLLEAVGVETAVINVPGHIYVAFALKAPPDEVKRAFSRPDELVIYRDTAWVPVEITMFQEDFEKAWQTGAKEWREHSGKEQAVFYPTRESWQVYQAVGFQEGEAGIQMPSRSAVTAAIESCLVRHVEKEIYSQEADIRAQLGQTQDETRLLNKLGVLYARNGLYDKALESFEEIVSQRQYTPALTNIGNIYFIKTEYEKALDYFQQAVSLNERNSSALLGLARCCHELEDYERVSEKYQELKALDPDMAVRFSYLDMRGEETARASDALGMAKIVAWEEEE